MIALAGAVGTFLLTLAASAVFLQIMKVYYWQYAYQLLVPAEHRGKTDCG